MKITRFNDLVTGGRTRKGRWELTPDHELVYKAEDLDEEIRFKGSLVAAEPDALVVSLTERQTDQTVVTGLAKLSGRWRADSRNRLLFEVEREGGRKDVLVFRSGWEIDERHRMVYSYADTRLKKKNKITRELLFDGHWDLSERNRLTYLLGGDSESAFRFRGAFQTRSIYAKKGEIRYQLGTEVNGRHKAQNVIFFGKWKVSRDLGLSFEMAGARGRKRTLSFGGEYSLDHGRAVSVALQSSGGKKLGYAVVFTKDFFGRDGQAFVRLQKSVEESRVEAGLKIRF